MNVESIRSEIAYRFSRSSGPGGQHANKSSTRAEAIFDVEGSQALSPAEKRRVLERVGPVLRAVAQDERSQLRNRELAADRIIEQLRAANHRARARTATKPTKGAREQRLESKHRRAGTKRLRGRPADDA